MWESVCSLWPDSGSGSFIKMLTRPLGQWALCSSCCPLSFAVSRSFAPHLPLHLLKPPPALTVVKPHCRKLPAVILLYLPSLALSCQSLLWQLLFYPAAVTLSGLFRFDLNTFQLCVNWAVINLIMLRHTNVTEWPSNKRVTSYQNVFLFSFWS